MATFTKNGYGQVEPNHLSAQRTGQIYAQLPADSTINVLENGQFVKYNYAAGKVSLDTAENIDGEYMMVFNEVKLYDDKWRESYKDFAMKKIDMVDGEMVPRVIKTNIGDIYTTNCIKDETVVVGDLMEVKGSTGLLEVNNSSTDPMQWKVVAITTMADGEPAVKLQRVK